MSQQSHLPPRSPLLTRASPFTGSDSLFSPNQKSSEAFIRHQRSPSQSSAIEQPPSWLDELLIDSETSVKSFFHRRSSSDSAAFMGGPCDFPKLLSLAEEEDAIYSEVGLWPNGSRDQACFDKGENALSLSCELLSSLREKTKKNEALTKKNEALHDLDLACVYGPNSPRLKPNILNSEVSVAPSFSDECVAQRNELHGADNFRNLDSGNSHGASCAHDTRLKGPRRHPGQRSRVRKLQYIAELERTVNAFETLKSEFAAKASSLFRQRVLLTIENNTLKRKIINHQQMIMIKDCQHQSLKKEVQRLKMVHRVEPENSSSSSHSSDNQTKAAAHDISWQLLEMGKLSLGGNPIPLKLGFRS
ncbi:hypothetical protein AMTRI_Chr11g95220 [Amborella trichopoda]